MARTTRNPFTLMLDPEPVLAAIARSEHLGRFERRICRPLDRPMPGEITSGEDAVADADPIPSATTSALQ